MIYTLTLNPAIDRTYFVDGVVIDGVNRIHDIRNEWGGKGINVARALNRSCIPVKAVALLGGINGRQLAEGIGAEGIDLVALEINGNTRINHVFVEKEGSSIKFNEPGPAIAPEEINQVVSLVDNMTKEEDIWVLSGSLPQGVSTSVYRQLIEVIHKKGGTVFLDANGKALICSLEARPDWIKPNYEEAIAVYPKEQSPKSLGELFIKNGAANVLLSLGAHGMMFFSRDEILQVRVPSLDVKNPVAAGDAAVAGFLYAITKHMNSVECVRWAAAFGTTAAASRTNCFQSLSEVNFYFEMIQVDEV